MTAKYAMPAYRWIRSCNLAHSMGIVIMFGLFTFVLAGSACLATSEKTNKDTPVIDRLVVDHPALYSLGNTVIECSASDPQGDRLTYSWVSDDGKIIGNGPKVTWEAPAKYGDFHILVSVSDSNGNTANKLASVSVVVRDSVKQPFCASCPR
jgi:hypothetical protein